MIYIVEDDRSVREAIALLLEETGIEACCFADGESFLQGARVADDDLVFVDLQLPGVQGADLIQRLRAKAKPPHIVAMSGKRLSEISQDFQGNERPPLLRKPLRAESLFKFIDR
ncbi:response regulator [Polycladidibacter hongkongensis]|uniref:response regulator n=1 Tax=Polycladidibacter hongkongensis TaxID=1647556 RepID=UPI0008363DED|nr:response regulator [Pseudovibrio hongkongensis]